MVAPGPGARAIILHRSAVNKCFIPRAFCASSWVDLFGMIESLRAETSYATFEIRDGMLCCVLKPDLILDIRTARKITEQRIELVSGVAYPTMIILHKEMLHFEKEGYGYFKSEEGMRLSLATALVYQRPIRSILTQLGDFFQRHKEPFRVFRMKSEARLWLFDFVPQPDISEL